MNINVNAHSSIQIDDIYIDPFHLKSGANPAGIICLTHTHYDHMSLEDIKKIVTNQTVFVAPKDAEETLNSNFPTNKKYYLLPNQTLTIKDTQIETFPAYNINKNFHKKEFNWLGYKLTKNHTSYVIVGDSDLTPELQKISCDVLFVPIGATYTMDPTEAATLTNIIKPKLVVPVHYNLIVGDKSNEKQFLNLIQKDINYQIFL